MATQGYSIFLLNGQKKQVSSTAGLDALFNSLAVGTLAAGLVIASVGGAFDFNNKALQNINGLTLAGGTVTGLPTTATGSTEATSKSYVNAQDALRVLKAGDSMTGNLDFGSAFKVTSLATPTAAGDAVNKAYADAIQVGARIQENVAVATTANITLTSAPTTIDGYTLVAGDRVLVKNQTAATDNGIYDFTAAGSAMSRDPSLNNTPNNDIFNGVLIPRIENGAQVGTSWIITSIGTGTGGAAIIGTDAINWGQFATPAAFTGGPGIWLNGMAITANVDGLTLDTSGAAANGSATIEIKNLGVTTAKLAATSVTAAKLGSDVAGVGLTGGNGLALAVNPDGLTLDTSGTGSALEIKTGGVGTTQLAALSVTTAKLAATSVTAAKLGSDVAGSGLTGGNGSALAVSVTTEQGVQITGSQVSGDYDRTLTNGGATAVSAGQVVYLDSTGKVQGLALASTTNLDQYEVFIADAALAGSTGTGRCVVRVGAIVAGFTGLTPGKSVYVSRSTAGGVTQDVSQSTGSFVSGENVYKVGRAISATEIRFQPSFEWQYA